MRKLWLIPVSAAFLIFCASHATAEGIRSAELSTEHYSLYIETLDAPETGRLLEEFYRQMTGYFGKSPPPGRLRVALYATKARFHAALAADAQPQVDAGGYYSPGTRKAYLWLQPSEYYTRQLLLHECTHQFHFLAATRNESPAAKWYSEGLAEYYGIHNWDGTHLTLRVIPPITLEDYPAMALDHFKNNLHSDLEGMITGRLRSEWAEGWALVHFLADEYPEKFRQLCTELDHQADPAAAWQKIFGPVTPAWVSHYEAWMTRNAQPWHIVWVSWQQAGDILEGKSDTSALTVLKQTPSTLTATIERVTSAARGGLIFGFQSDENFNAWQLWGTNEVRIVHFVNGKWKGTQYFKLAPHEGPDVLSLRSMEGKIVLSANGAEITRIKADGKVGLYVQDGTARFHVGK